MTHGCDGLTAPPPGRAMGPRSSWLTPAVVVVCALALAMSGCGGENASSHGARVAAVIKPLENPFFATMRAGLVATAKQHMARISVRAALALQDTAGQASALESLIAKGANCYIVNPIDQSNLIPAAQSHLPHGTPIVNIDSPVGTFGRRRPPACASRPTSGPTTSPPAGSRPKAMAGRASSPRARAWRSSPASPATSRAATARTPGFNEGGARSFHRRRSPVAADFDRETGSRLAAEDVLIARTRRESPASSPSTTRWRSASVDAARGAGPDDRAAVAGDRRRRHPAEALAAVRRGGELSATDRAVPLHDGSARRRSLSCRQSGQDDSADDPATHPARHTA